MAGEYINDEVFDQGLDYFAGQTDIRVDITSQVATSYTEAITTYTLGNKTGLTAGATVDGTSGRKVQIPQITDGSVTGTDTATHWAVSDVSGTALIATGPLTTSQSVTNGNTFTLDAIDIQINDATVT
jgi:hypothetical protein